MKVIIVYFKCWKKSKKYYSIVISDFWLYIRKIVGSINEFQDFEATLFVELRKCKSKYLSLGKVQLFWESHKNLRNRPHGFDVYLVNVKTMRNIAPIFVAFSEKLNFKIDFPLDFQSGFKIHGCKMHVWNSNLAIFWSQISIIDNSYKNLLWAHKGETLESQLLKNP